MPDLLSTVLGALPELGTIGVALVVLVVVRRQQATDTASLREQAAEDRQFFAEERARIRAETQEEIRAVRESAAQQRTDLLAEMRELKTELREAERQVDELRSALYPRDPATTVLPRPSRHRAAGTGG